MSNFGQAVLVILRHEGGWVNNPLDPGGETNFGISMKFIKNEGLTPQDLGVPNFNPGCLKQMTIDTAKAIYRRCWWDRYSYSSINDQIAATKVFDASVNMGPNRAHKLAQASCNALGASLVVDGQLGPASIAAINGCHPRQFVSAMVGQMSDFYQAIVKAKPSQVVFLKAWLRRASWAG